MFAVEENHENSNCLLAQYYEVSRKVTSLRFYKKWANRSRYVSQDGRWCAQRIELPPPLSFVWVLLDVKTGARYEKPSVIEALRLADQKAKAEASGATL